MVEIYKRPLTVFEELKYGFMYDRIAQVKFEDGTIQVYLIMHNGFSNRIQ